jgi:hypothetical protein
MAILLLGSVETIFNISEREFMTLVDFAFSELKLPERVSIFFEFEHIEEIENFYGFTHTEDCGDNEYHIVISPRITDWSEVAKTVFHEMEHIRQDVHKDRFGDTWKGVYYDREVVSYHALPWEVAAYRKEEELYLKYLMD